MTSQGKVFDFINRNLACNLSKENITLADGNKNSVASINGVELFDCHHVNENTFLTLITVDIDNKFKISLTDKYLRLNRFFTPDQLNQMNNQSEIVGKRRVTCQFIRYFDLQDQGDNMFKLAHSPANDTEFRFNCVDLYEKDIFLGNVESTDKERIKNTINDMMYPEHQMDSLMMLRQLKENIFLDRDILELTN